MIFKENAHSQMGNRGSSPLVGIMLNLNNKKYITVYEIINGFNNYYFAEKKRVYCNGMLGWSRTYLSPYKDGRYHAFKSKRSAISCLRQNIPNLRKVSKQEKDMLSEYNKLTLSLYVKKDKKITKVIEDK